MQLTCEYLTMYKLENEVVEEEFLRDIMHLKGS